MALGDGPDIDRLILDLHAPMLTNLMRSSVMRNNMGDVAKEINRRWAAKVPRESGNLAATGHVTYHKDATFFDRRWVADFTAGGPRAPYAPAVEAEHMVLAQVLRDMGYFTGDMRIVGG